MVYSFTLGVVTNVTTTCQSRLLLCPLCTSFPVESDILGRQNGVQIEIRFHQRKRCFAKATVGKRRRCWIGSAQETGREPLLRATNL